MANKVKFGLSNCAYAKATITDGIASYGTVKSFPGAVSLSMSPSGDRNVFYADNIEYYISSNVVGREGDFEVAKIIDAFHEDILGAQTDGQGVVVDNPFAPTVHFALLFEFAGDESATRHVLYNCTASAPAIASQTTEGDSVTPVTETLSLKSSAIYNTVLSSWTDHASCASASTAYSNWYSAVYQTTTT